MQWVLAFRQCTLMESRCLKLKHILKYISVAYLTFIPKDPHEKGLKCAISQGACISKTSIGIKTITSLKGGCGQGFKASVAFDLN